jgi:hypothetical protein
VPRDERSRTWLDAGRGAHPLLEELRRIASFVEPVPPETVAAARAAFAWRTIDAELAALVHDSLVDTSAAGLRAPTSRCCWPSRATIC